MVTCLMKQIAIVGFLLGGIAPILSFIPVLSMASNLLSFIGTVLILYAYWKIAREWQHPTLQRYANRMIFLAVATVVLSIIIAYRVVVLILAAGIDWDSLQDPTMVQSPEMQQQMMAAVLDSVGSLLLWGILFYVTVVFWAWFFFQANKIIADHTGNDTFRIGGLFMLIGTAGLIVFGLGFLLAWAAYWILLVAFFSFPDQPPALEQESNPV